MGVFFALGFLFFSRFCPSGKRRRRDEICDKCSENSDGDIGQVHIVVRYYTHTVYLGGGIRVLYVFFTYLMSVKCLYRMYDVSYVDVHARRPT